MSRRGVSVVLLLAFAFTTLSGLPAGPAAGSSATADVDVTNFAFTPPDVSLQAGDSITWHWVSGTHSVETQDGSDQWCSTRSSGQCDKTFNTPGTYEYRCGVHPGSMLGTIVVQGEEPSVTIDAPTDGETVEGTFTATGSATHPQGIDDVSWSIGGLGVPVDEITETPDGVTWSTDIDTSSLPNGANTLTVRATSSDGQTATAEHAFVVDNPPFIELVARSLAGGDGLLSTRLDAMVENVGNTLVTDLQILFEYAYEGSWHEIETVTADIDAGARQLIDIEWASEGKVGSFDVRVVLDPDASTDDADRSNNQEEATASFVHPELPGTDPFAPL